MSIERMSRMNKYFKEFIHNVFVHPLMMFLPCELANKLHDRNATWAFGLSRYNELKLEERE